MTKINLDYRLSEIFSNVKGKVIADIGCDHGKLSYKLLEEGVADYVYISDISSPSLDKAITLLSESKYSGHFTAIVSDGFDNYPQNICIDTAIISGMGGREIVNILSQNTVLVSRYVLQPQHNEADVKMYLINNGYNIEKDYIIKQKDKYYNIIVCIKGIRAYKDSEIYFGETNYYRDTIEFENFLDYEQDKTMKILDSVDEEKKYVLLKYLDYIKEAKSRLGV